MPIIPPASSSQYDSVNQALTSANSRLSGKLDTLQPVSGKILGNTNANSLQFTNSAWRKMQDQLASRGYARLNNECIIGSFPKVASLDPASQAWLSWTGCFDGANYFPVPCLPADFTHPLKMWERYSGQNQPWWNPQNGMEKIMNGLPAPPKMSGMRFWEWRGDAIYMPGSLMVEDLRIRYVKYLADFADVGSVPWFDQLVPIMRGSDSLSWFICAEVASARGDMETSQMFLANATEALKYVFNLDVRANQNVNVRRQSRSGRLEGGGGTAWGCVY